MEYIEVNQEFIDKMNKFREKDPDKKLFENCRDNVVYFSENMLGLKLYAWQVLFLNKIQEKMRDPEADREFVALTSRQIGKSTSLAVLSIWAAVFNKYPGTLSNNTSVGIASASDVQAKKLLYEMKKFIRLGDGYMERTYLDSDERPIFGKTFFSDLLDENEPNNTTTITFKPYDKDVHGIMLQDSLSGSTIKSYPPTSAVLGETFSIMVIDEAGKTDKISDQFFYDYMYPTGNSTNAIRVYTSTPWVSSGFFYRMVDPDDVYKGTPADVVVFTVDAIKIENPKYYEVVMKTVNSLNADGKNDEVQRAYYCRFVKGEMSYFNPDRVMDVFDNEVYPLNSYKDQCDMGIDFGGQSVSRTVITISALDGTNKIRRLYHRVYGVGEDNGLVDDVAALLKDFNIQRIIPDDCPQGDYLIREMIERGWNVHPMNFRSEKVKKYGAFRSTVNRKEVISYPDEDMKTEMLALEFNQGKKASVIQHAPGYSDDLIDSFVMSTYFYVQDDSGIKTFSWGDEDDIGADVYGWDNA